VDLEIVVTNSAEKQISFGQFGFSHSGCSLMTAHRDPATNLHTIKCSCGLELEFEDNGVAMSNIIDAVTDGEKRYLPENSFKSNIAANLLIIPDQS
jgi:hypothetical protein